MRLISIFVVALATLAIACTPSAPMGENAKFSTSDASNRISAEFSKQLGPCCSSSWERIGLNDQGTPDVSLPETVVLLQSGGGVLAASWGVEYGSGWADTSPYFGKVALEGDIALIGDSHRVRVLQPFMTDWEEQYPLYIYTVLANGDVQSITIYGAESFWRLIPNIETYKKLPR